MTSGRGDGDPHGKKWGGDGECGEGGRAARRAALLQGSDVMSDLDDPGFDKAHEVRRVDPHGLVVVASVEGDVLLGEESLIDRDGKPIEVPEDGHGSELTVGEEISDLAPTDHAGQKKTPRSKSTRTRKSLGS